MIILSLVLILIWFLSEFTGSYLIPGIRFPKTNYKNKDRGSGFLITADVIVSVLVSLIFLHYNILIIHFPVVYAGLSLFFAGIIIRQSSVYTLGTYFSLHIRALEHHKIIKKGLYKYIRHPQYLGIILSTIGFSTTFGSMPAILLTLIITGWVFHYRMNVEEDFLKNKLGKDYEDYIGKTKRIIPYLY